MGSVTKKIRKIIPKEIRPAVPFIAAYFGGPALGAKLGIKSALGQKIAGKALTAALASKAQGDDTSAALRSAALAAAPDVLSGGLGNVAARIDPNLIADADSFVQIGDTAAKTAGALSRAGEAIKGAGALKTIGAQSAIEGSAQLAEIQQDQIDAYNRQLQEQGLMDKTKRRQSIFNIYMNAGYEPDYVNSVLDKYGYADGGIAHLAKGGNPRAGRRSRGTPMMTSAMKKFYGIEDEEEIKLPKKKPEVIEIDEGEEIETDDKGNKIIRSKSDLATGLREAASGIEAAFGRGFGNMEPVPMLRFAKGGEVEEETEDLGIMDFMKDQGVPYGEMASDINNERILEQLYEEFLDMGLSPADAAKAAREAFDRMSSKPREGIMQMASGYKTDIEEMYEQYVFEMEEMGLQPMSFAEFLAQARAGMADGGKAQRRKKGEPADEIIETEQEIFIDTMPRPRRREGIMEAADGGIMEKDMRGGGFIPEGSKERADDVPARLSKNEFVMTADAVRAAGGGSVNKGAKRMYDLMYTLEGKI